MLRVTSSPVSPSPRVAATASRPSLVAQADREAVELELRHVLDRRRVGGELELAPHARVELARRPADRRVGLGADRQHRHAMRDRRELAAAALPPTRCVGESGVHQRRMLGLERLQLAEQRVVLGVADRRRVRVVVALVVLRRSRALAARAARSRSAAAGAGDPGRTLGHSRAEQRQRARAARLDAALAQRLGRRVDLLADRGERRVVERALVVVDELARRA